MSNTAMEEITNSEFVYGATGDVLLGGLGLGRLGGFFNRPVGRIPGVGLARAGMGATAGYFGGGLLGQCLWAICAGIRVLSDSLSARRSVSH